MKKTLTFLLFATGLSSPVIAQNVWTGTTTPTTTTGKAGIGTTSPTAKLHVAQTNGSTWTEGLRVDNTVNLGSSLNGNIFSVYSGSITFPPSSPAQLFAVNRFQTVISNSLRIGATAPSASGSYANYKLSVDGDMIAKRCVIQVSDWADYVFNDNYEMPTLGELETYINNNNHLPGVPTTEEVKENGIEIGDINKILLQKVEELTLYMIDLQKQNEALKSRIQNLESK